MATLPAGVNGSMSQQTELTQKSTILLFTLIAHILEEIGRNLNTLDKSIHRLMENLGNYKKTD